MTRLTQIKERKDLNDIYEAVQELVCAFVVNQEEVERARKSKKSMLKVYQDRDRDLELAFRDFLDTCEQILGL